MNRCDTCKHKKQDRCVRYEVCIDIARRVICFGYKAKDVFVALKGEAKSEEEVRVFDELIEMILCLDKHKNIRENSRVESKLLQ